MVTVDGPFDDGAQTLVITADVNFDGTIGDGEKWIYQRTEPGAESFGFTMRDDGPSPGNGTSQDPLTIRAEFVDDVKEKKVEVKNVEPDLVGVPSVFYHELNGERFAVVRFSVIDPGVNHIHTATLTWSDNVVTEAGGFIKAYTCSYVFTKIISRMVLPGVQVSVKSLVVRDDDLGVTRRFRENLELDVNDDDDNLNLQEDLSDRGFNDDDLKPINLQRLITPGMDPRRGTRYLHYDPSSVRVWNSQSKRNLIPNGSSITDQDQVWVEGVSASRSEITIQWNSSDGVGCSVFGSITGNVIDVIVTKQMLDLDTDSDNTGIVDRSDYEDSIENTAGKGKKLFKRSSPAETILETNAFGQSTGYTLTLTVSPGLNAWADAAKTARITSATSSSIPTDDRESETYTWTSWGNRSRIGVSGLFLGYAAAA